MEKHNLQRLYKFLREIVLAKFAYKGKNSYIKAINYKLISNFLAVFLVVLLCLLKHSFTLQQSNGSAYQDLLLFSRSLNPKSSNGTKVPRRRKYCLAWCTISVYAFMLDPYGNELYERAKETQEDLLCHSPFFYLSSIMRPDIITKVIARGSFPSTALDSYCRLKK